MKIGIDKDQDRDDKEEVEKDEEFKNCRRIYGRLEK